GRGDAGVRAPRHGVVLDDRVGPVDHLDAEVVVGHGVSGPGDTDLDAGARLIQQDADRDGVAVLEPVGGDGVAVDGRGRPEADLDAVLGDRVVPRAFAGDGVAVDGGSGAGVADHDAAPAVVGDGVVADGRGAGALGPVEGALADPDAEPFRGQGRVDVADEVIPYAANIGTESKIWKLCVSSESIARLCFVSSSAKH